MTGPKRLENTGIVGRFFRGCCVWEVLLPDTSLSRHHSSSRIIPDTYHRLSLRSLSPPSTRPTPRPEHRLSAPWPQLSVLNHVRHNFGLFSPKALRKKPKRHGNVVYKILPKSYWSHFRHFSQRTEINERIIIYIPWHVFFFYIIYLQWIYAPIYSLCSNVTKRLAGNTTLAISFVSEAFPYKEQIEDLFIVMSSFCLFSTLLTFSALLLMSIV